MPVSDPDVSRPSLIRDATFLEADRREIALRRGPHNRLGFAYQVAFVRVLGRFPQQAPLEIDGEILRFAALQLGADAEKIHAYARRQQTVSEHQQRIGEYLRLRTFDTTASERLARFLEDEALRLDRTASLLARARGWLRDEHVLAPADSVLRRAVGAARHKARALLTQRMTESLSAPMRDRLDELVAVGDDHPHSPLHGIKTGTSSPSVGGMKRLLARLESIEATGVLDIDVSWVNGNYQRILFHSVRTASADRVREMAAPRRHLALVCFLHQAWRDTLDQAVDMYGKLLDRNRKLVEDRLDDMLKAQRHAVDRIVQRYRRLGAVLLDSDVGDDELRTRLLSIVPEEQLREDQSDLASWTRGDRKARFEQTAERHAGLSQFAAPFLSRMKFVDEQGEGASPTLSALRAYREHRAAGCRGLPPDVSIDFVPPALQPLIRHNGVTDRRRWESALFLKVRDEIQTGNLAIEGAKNFGRFEAFFLPSAQWEQVRDAFWARTGFPVDPAAAVEHLKARLSDAFDRFLEGVADNRQVTFDDDGWRLKTDPTEQPDPAQSDRLAELHRWLDARNRTIRLADLLIEVENDLGFSVHFQQPGERVDPGEVCALLAAILAHGCNLGLYTMEKVAPDIAYRRLKYVSDWRLVEENQRAALAAIVHGISRLDAAGHWGDGTTSASDGQRFAMPQKVLQRTYSTRFNDFALEFYSFVADNYAPFYSRPVECTDRDAPFVLDGVLYHESDLNLEEHYTDTHGYTEINFAAFGMVGMRFCPPNPQPAPPADLLRRPGPRPRRPRAGPPARPSGGELPPHRRAVGPHRPVLRGVPRRACHRVRRPAAAQPLPGLEPLLRRQPRARTHAEDRVRAAVHVRAETAGEGATGLAQGRAAPRLGAGRLLRAAGAYQRPRGLRPDERVLVPDPDPRLHRLLAGPGDLTPGRRAGLPVRPRPAASRQPDRVEERRPLRRDQDRPRQAQGARPLGQ